ncbi:MAG TPA: hypothetical protein ENO05_01335 [Bacteroides sp.]|nr:hypothetical protein [Bacteroides sp.]
MSRITLTGIIPLTGLLLVAASQHADKGFFEAERTDEGLRLTEKGQTVLFFRSKPVSRKGQYTRNNYIHPLLSLSGDTLTEDFPDDHRHHRGIFWAWHQVWVGQQRLGDAWSCENFSWDIHRLETDIRRDMAVISVNTHWKSPAWKDADGNPEPFAEENTKITVFPADNHIRKLKFKITVTSLTDSLRVGGSEDVKGYGGFSWRVKLPEDVMFTGSEGALMPETAAVKAGPWIYMYGTFSGNKPAGILMMSDPANPGDPEQWVLREKHSMQNAVFPGNIPVVLNHRDSFTLNYCMVIHEYPPAQFDPAEQYREYLENKANI